jgi:hypothetical protein
LQTLRIGAFHDTDCAEVASKGKHSPLGFIKAALAANDATFRAAHVQSPGRGRQNERDRIYGGKHWITGFV